jgi:hypothetical protein
MKKIFILVAITIATALGGCAKQIEDISAVEISGDPYQEFTCYELAKEHLKLSQKVKAYFADDRGAFFLGTQLFRMSGNDEEAEIAITKGSIYKIQRKQVEKDCRLAND